MRCRKRPTVGIRCRKRPVGDILPVPRRIHRPGAANPPRDPTKTTHSRFLVEVTSQAFADLEASKYQASFNFQLSTFKLQHHKHSTDNLCLTLKAFVLKMGERKQNELDSATTLQRIQRNGNCDIIPDYSGYIIAAFV
ncbi:hypothetical protein L1887_14098 [Cichorium endivia]|nr:hypothetical protein L1887_14098 [Cichorium endivia]